MPCRVEALVQHLLFFGVGEGVRDRSGDGFAHHLDHADGELGAHRCRAPGRAPCSACARSSLRSRDATSGPSRSSTARSSSRASASSAWLSTVRRGARSSLTISVSTGTSPAARGLPWRFISASMRLPSGSSLIALREVVVGDLVAALAVEADSGCGPSLSRPRPLATTSSRRAKRSKCGGQSAPRLSSSSQSAGVSSPEAISTGVSAASGPLRRGSAARSRSRARSTACVSRRLAVSRVGRVDQHAACPASAPWPRGGRRPAAGPLH